MPGFSPFRWLGLDTVLATVTMCHEQAAIRMTVAVCCVHSSSCFLGTS
jgi:hypothetical protein